MPTSSTITSTSKSKIKSALPSSTYKILTATVARVYVAHPDPNVWSYTGIEGGLAFVKLLNTGGTGFRVVDLKGTRGVIWDHDLYDGLVYNQDRSFFHTFEGDDFLIGFSFADEGEASDFVKKVNARAKYSKPSSSSKTSAVAATSSSSKKKKSKGGPIDKSMISSPSGFQHVAHMGYTNEEGFSSRNVDPSWAALLEKLSSMGVSEKDIAKNERFIKDFVGARGGPTSAAKPAAPKAKKTPPPAPVRSARKQPPPPPAPRNRPGSSVPAAPPAPPAPPARGGAASSAAPPPPPPPPARPTSMSAAAPAPPPPPPARGGAAVPPPPPPPPSRGGAGGAAVPPPPPPPPARPAAGGAAPPPPPPPPGAPAAPAAPAPQEGRGALLASIQGAGIHQLRKTEGGDSTPSRVPSGAVAAGAAGGAGLGAAAAAAGAGGDDSVDTSESGAGGGDLASALAAALNQRKGNMGDDSDEEESEEEW